MKLVLIGFGGVGKAFLELLTRCPILHKKYWQNIYIIEPQDLGDDTSGADVRGIGAKILRRHHYRHLKVTLTKENIDKVMTITLNRGDIVVDVSVNVDALAIMKCCHRAGCMYVNTSMENWAFPDASHIDTSPHALYYRSLCSRIHMGRKMFGKNGPTMVCDHGMNPGLISHFVMKGIVDMATHLNHTQALEHIQRRDFAGAASALDIKVIHITEWDNQETTEMRPRGVFWNTWSAEGLLAESLDPVQIGFGTTDTSKLPSSTLAVANMRILPVRGMDMKNWSVSPDRMSDDIHRFVGYSIPHGEANTISQALTTADGKYRPTVFFVYQPCPAGRASLEEVRKNEYQPGEKFHVLTLPQLKSGYDAIGALLIRGTNGLDRESEDTFEESKMWWCGTILDFIDMAPLGVEYSGPTVIQVSISLICALKWMTQNGNKGFCTPEDLPWEILNEALPYLGKIYSGPVRASADNKIIPGEPKYDDFHTNEAL